MLGPLSIAKLPAVADHVLTMMRATSPVGAAAALRGRAERPAYDDVLAGLDVPALVIVGSDDAYTTRTHAEQMRDLLRGSDLLWMDDVGHMPNLESEAEFNRALVRLLGQVALSAKVPSISIA